MVRILDTYVYKEIAPPFLIGVCVFTFFLVVDRIYDLTDLVITKGVPFHLVLSLLAFMLPAFLAMTLPMALLVAVLLACGRLSGDLEVAALKASGVSPYRLLRPFLVAGLVVALASATLTLAIAPWASGAVQRQLFVILQSRAATGITERLFTGAFGQFVIYVDEVSPSQVALRRLLVSDERDPALSRIIVAREGRLLTDEERRRVTLRFIDGSISEAAVAEPGRFRHTAFSLYDMTLPLESVLPSAPRLERPERDLSLGALLRRATEASRQGQAAAPYRVELHKRFALPVAVLVFVLVGFPLGVGSHRGGRGLALTLSFSIVLSYYALFTTLEGLALRERLPAAGAIWLPNALFGLLGVGLLRVSAGRVDGFAIRGLWRLRGALRPGRTDPPGSATPEPARARPGRRRDSTFIIDRYLLREYLKLLAIGSAVGAVLFIVGDLLHTLDRYVRLKPPLIYIAEHFLYRLPAALYQGFPIIVLIATLFLFLSLTRQRELDALKAAGVSLHRVSLPILLAAAGISGASIVFQEGVLPRINARAEEVDNVKIRGNLPRHLQRQSEIWYRASDTRFFHVRLVDPVERSLDGLLVLDLDQDFRLMNRLDAHRARWTPAGWELSEGFSRRVGPTNDVASTPFTRRVVELKERIEDFVQIQKAPETMSFSELRAYVDRLQDSGRQVGKYIVQLYAKLSFPLVHVIMALVAIPFALVSPRSGGRAVGIGVAIVISVSYWVIHSMAVSFAKADLLPPVLAAWTANIVFAGVGAALFVRADT